MSDQVQPLIISNSRFEFIASQWCDKLISAFDHDHTVSLDSFRFFDAIQHTKIMTCLNQVDTGETPAIKCNAIINLLSLADPTAQYKYTQWLVAKYCKKDFSIQDLERIKLELERFEQHKNKLACKDINQYKSIRDVYVVIQQLLSEPRLVSLTEIEQQFINDNQATIFYHDDKLKIIIPLTQIASCYFGRGTRWCTAATQTTNHFDTYNRQGPLYVVQFKHDKYQFHFETNSFRDALDASVPISRLVHNIPQLKKAFEQQAVQFDILELLSVVTSEHLFKFLINKHVDNDRLQSILEIHHNAIDDDIVELLLTKHPRFINYIQPHQQNISIAVTMVDVLGVDVAQRLVRKDLQANDKFKEALVVKRPMLLKSPKVTAHQTSSMVHKVIAKSPMMLRYVRKDLITPELAMLAVSAHPASFFQVPRHMRTKQLIDLYTQSKKYNNQ